MLGEIGLFLDLLPEAYVGCGQTPDGRAVELCRDTCRPMRGLVRPLGHDTWPRCSDSRKIARKGVPPKVSDGRGALGRPGKDPSASTLRRKFSRREPRECESRRSVLSNLVTLSYTRSHRCPVLGVNRAFFGRMNL